VFGASPLRGRAPGADGVPTQIFGVEQTELRMLACRFAERNGGESIPYNLMLSIKCMNCASEIRLLLTMVDYS
jgi:hypothetical protein